MWAIYTKTDKKPMWLSSDEKSLTKILSDLTSALGNNFYISTYEEKNEGIS